MTSQSSFNQRIALGLGLPGRRFHVATCGYQPVQIKFGGTVNMLALLATDRVADVPGGLSRSRQLGQTTNDFINRPDGGTETFAPGTLGDRFVRLIDAETLVGYVQRTG